MACGGEPSAASLPQELTSVTVGLNFAPSTSIAELVGTVERLRAVIRDRHITHVHAHPFTSLFPALLAACMEEVPSIFTLHGPASIGSGYGPIYDFILKSLLLPSSDRVVAVSGEVRDLVSPYVAPEHLVVQNNAVDVAHFKPDATSTAIDDAWLVVSRLDALKIVGIRKFVNDAEAAGLQRIVIAGDGPAQGALQDQLRDDGSADRVTFLGRRHDVRDLMSGHAGVAGMGRVLLEGIACGKPVCLVGYDGVKGIVDAPLYQQAAYANFSGRNLPVINGETLKGQLEFLRQNGAPQLEIPAEAYSEEEVWKAFSERSEEMHMRRIPLLRDIYALMRTDELIASTGSYLDSQELFDGIGSIVNSLNNYVPATVASHAFYESQKFKARGEYRHVELLRALSQFGEPSEVDIANHRLVELALRDEQVIQNLERTSQSQAAQREELMRLVTQFRAMLARQETELEDRRIALEEQRNLTQDQEVMLGRQRMQIEEQNNSLEVQQALIEKSQSILIEKQKIIDAIWAASQEQQFVLERQRCAIEESVTKLAQYGDTLQSYENALAKRAVLRRVLKFLGRPLKRGE